MNTPPVRLLDVIPREMIQEPYKEDARYENVKRFLKIAAPFGVGVGLSFIVGIAVFPLLWYAGAIFFMVGIGAACAVKILYDEYVLSRKDFDTRRLNHTNILIQVSNLVQQITINQTVNVKSGAVFNNAGSPTLPLQENKEIEPIDSRDPLNDLYDIALTMAQTGIIAWNENKGTRPRVKPYSAELMTERLHIGRDRWGEAIQLIDDAKVIANPETRTWKPLVKNETEAKATLDKYIQSLGYLRNRTASGREEWIKK